MAPTVRKSSGTVEDFQNEKLYSSLIRSGASPEIADRITKQVQKELPPLSGTRDIYRLARKLLRKYNRISGMRYSLKKALFSLGPSGYPFEKYVARILKGYGYSVKVGQLVEGYCVKHEVDVVAYNGREHFIIECKYHSNAGKATDVKVALYIQSRFLDIKRAYEKSPQYRDRLHEGWLITNTRCTSDAIQFAECTGLRIVSWRYPKEKSLESMIEEKRLYPVTILPSARRKSVDALFRNNIVLAQDIADMDIDSFIKHSGIEAGAARIIKKEADDLCPCTL